MQLFCTSQQEYIVATNVYHINKNIHVETSLTNAKKYNSIKSAIKLFKSFKSFNKFKFNIFSSKFNSTSRICFLINQVARISQYQHIAIDSTSRFCFSVNQITKTSYIDFTSCRSFKVFKFVVFVNSFNSTFRFSLSVNHDSLKLSRIDFLRVLINQQIIYVLITRVFVVFRQRYLVSSTFLHKHLDIRVETTLRKKKR